MNNSPILAGVDGSAASVTALRWAAAEAVRLDLSVDALFGAPKKRGEPLDPQVLLTASVDTAVPAASPERHRVSPQVVVGEPADVLIERSSGAFLLVLGRSHGRDPLHTSTMSRCLRHARCPVAVVPSSVPEPGGQSIGVPTPEAYGALADRPVGEVMTPHVLGVDATSGVDVALQMMVGAGVHHLPVMEESRCVGLLYETDVVWRMAGWSSLDRPPSASELARKPVPLLTADQTVREAAQELIRKAGNAVLVTDRDQVVGVLTADDLVTLLQVRVPDEVPESPRPPAASTSSAHEGTMHDGQ